MVKRRMKPASPGEIILEDWLKPLNMSQSALAAKMGVDAQVVNGIVRGRRRVTARTALQLARVLKTTPQFWMNLQAASDLWKARRRNKE
jgi:antitoxin HigA-1